MAKSINEFPRDNAESSEQLPSREALEARAAIRPNFLAANTIRRFNHVLGNLDLMALTNELNTQVISIHEGDLGRAEETLAAQIVVLDTLFNTLAVKALQAPRLDMQAILLKLVLQAQRQCCQTIEALVAIKKPAAVTVVRQTNIGQAVQVNNSATDETTKPILENEVLEVKHGERMDIGTKIASVTANQDMAAVEKLDRPQKRSR
ncbi:MAG: hypothetical protein WC856_26280 [Methylococcaceae bacterium]|jgi:hypothetical protein